MWFVTSSSRGQWRHRHVTNSRVSRTLNNFYRSTKTTIFYSILYWQIFTRLNRCDTYFQTPESEIPIVQISLSYMIYNYPGVMVKNEVPNCRLHNVGSSFKMFKCSNLRLVENISWSTVTSWSSYFQFHRNCSYSYIDQADPPSCRNVWKSCFVPYQQYHHSQNPPEYSPVHTHTL